MSSAASQIEAKGGENLHTTVTLNGATKQVPDYAIVQGILIGEVAAFILAVTILGPEAHGAHFEKHRWQQTAADALVVTPTLWPQSSHLLSHETINKTRS